MVVMVAGWMGMNGDDVVVGVMRAGKFASDEWMVVWLGMGVR